MPIWEYHLTCRLLGHKCICKPLLPDHVLQKFALACASPHLSISRWLCNKLPAMSLGRCFTFAATQGLLGCLLLWYSAVEIAVAATGPSIDISNTAVLRKTARDPNELSPIVPPGHEVAVAHETGTPLRDPDIIPIHDPPKGTSHDQGEQEAGSNENEEAMAELFGDYYLDTQERKVAGAQSALVKGSLKSGGIIILFLLLLESFSRFYLAPLAGAAQAAYDHAHPGRNPLGKGDAVLAALLSSPIALGISTFAFFMLSWNALKLTYNIYSLIRMDREDFHPENRKPGST